MKKKEKLNEDTLLDTEYKNEDYIPEDEYPIIHITSLDQYKELTINKVKCCKIFYSDKIIAECQDWFCDYILDTGKKNKKINEESKTDESVEDTIEAEFDELFKDEIDDEKYDYEDDYVDWIDELTDEQANEIYEKYIKGVDEAPTILIESLEQYKYITINQPNTYNMMFVSSELRRKCSDWYFDYIFGEKL